MLSHFRLAFPLSLFNFSQPAEDFMLVELNGIFYFQVLCSVLNFTICITTAPITFMKDWKWGVSCTTNSKQSINKLQAPMHVEKSKARAVVLIFYCGGEDLKFGFLLQLFSGPFTLWGLGLTGAVIISMVFCYLNSLEKWCASFSFFFT